MQVFVLPVDEGTAKRAEENSSDTTNESSRDAEFDAARDLNWHRGHSTLWWTLRALDQAQRVKTIQVVGYDSDSPATRAFMESEIAEFPRACLLLLPAIESKKQQSSESEPDRAQDWLAELQRLRPYLERPALVCTASTPAATSTDYDQLIEHFSARGGEGALPFAAREALEKLAPASESESNERPFSPLLDDAWRPGYCAILSMPVLEGLAKWLTRLEEISTQMKVSDDQTKVSYGPLMRHGWKISREIGWGFLWRAYKRQLQLSDAEKNVSRLLNCRVRAIEMERPHLAITTSNARWEEFMPAE